MHPARFSLLRGDVGLAIKLNKAGLKRAKSLISAGDVDLQSGWSSFAAADGAALLGDGEPKDWDAYGAVHLAVDSDAEPNTPARYGYPFARRKGDKLIIYRAAIKDIRTAAASAKQTAIFNAADEILDLIDDFDAAQVLAGGSAKPTAFVGASSTFSVPAGGPTAMVQVESWGGGGGGTTTVYAEGVSARIGKVIKNWDGQWDQRGLSAIQALSFEKDKFTLSAAMKWLRDNSFWPSEFEDGDDAYVFPVENSDRFDTTSLKFVPYTQRGSLLFDTYQHAKSIVRWNESSPLISYAAEPGFTIYGVEIFKVGKWNGDEYTIKDLDDIVESFDKVGYNVPVKLGHSDAIGEPAYGWVSAIRRDGDKLIADFKNVPQKIYDAIKERAYDAVSCEIFWNLERDGKTFPRALKAVALLGSETPAVSGLAPLRTVTSLPAVSAHGRVLSYKCNLEIAPMTTTTSAPAETKTTAEKTPATTQAAADQDVAVLKANLEAAQAQLQSFKDSGMTPEAFTAMLADNKRLKADADAARERERLRLIDERVAKCQLPAIRDQLRIAYDIVTSHPKEVAFKQGETTIKDPVAVLDSMVEGVNKVLGARLFSQESVSDQRERPEGSAFTSPAEAGREVAKRIAEFQAKNPSATFASAMKAVLSADPDLKDAYASVQN